MLSTKYLEDLMPGPLDIHAHLLPRDCFSIPAVNGVIHITEREGELHLGDFPIAVTEKQLSSATDMITDMDESNIAVRVVSAPPYAFSVDSEVEAAVNFASNFNRSIMDLVSRYPERLVPFGIVPVQDSTATAAEIRRLVRMGIPGIAVPPIAGHHALGDQDLSHVITEAEKAGLAVLVHPMQQLRPGFNAHYLQNLIGNPVESATAIASLLLGGWFERLPDLRIAFVHGAGVAPALLGRWDHGYANRHDVRCQSPDLPSAVYKEHIYADALTHSDEAASLLKAVTDPSRILLGSDYPFDMADRDPVSTALKHGLNLDQLRDNALQWLGARP